MLYKMNEGIDLTLEEKEKKSAFARQVQIVKIK